MGQAVQWRPPGAGWVNHDNSPVAASDRFPAPPPPEIGTVSSASTWFDENGPKDGSRTGLKIVLAVCMLLLSALIPGMLAIALAKDFAVAAGVTAGVTVVSTWILLAIIGRKQPACSFVGTDGIALFTGRGSKVFGRILTYAEIGDVDVARVDVTLAGAAVGKRFEFAFTNRSGKVALKFVGLHGPKTPPAPHDHTAFGMAAAAAWRNRAS